MKPCPIQKGLATIVLAVCIGTVLSLVNFYSGAEKFRTESNRSSRSTRTELLTFTLQSDLNQLSYFLHRWQATGNLRFRELFQRTADHAHATLAELKENESGHSLTQDAVEELSIALDAELTEYQDLFSSRPGYAAGDAYKETRRHDYINSLLQYLQKNANAELSSAYLEFVTEESDTKYRIAVISSLITFLVILISYLMLQRRGSELRLKEADRKILDLYEYSPCGYLALDASGTIIQINQTELNRLGRRKEEVVGRMKVFDIIHPDYQKVAHELFLKLGTDGLLTDISVPFLNAAGNTYWVRANATSENNTDGKRLHQINTIEITESRQNLERMRFQARLLEECNDAIISLDLESRITSWNKGAERMYGYTESEALGRKINDLVGLDKPLTPTEIEGIIRALISNNRVVGERTHHHKSGDKINVMYSISPLTDKRGEIVGAIAVNQDISLRKRFEEHLLEFNIALEQRVRENTEEFRQLVAGISDAFLAFDQELRFRFVNRKAAELLGDGTTECLGKPLIESRSPLNTQKVVGLLKKVMETRETETEELHCSATGSHFLCRVYPNENGVTLLIEDDTKRRLAEQHLIESAEKYRTFFENSPLPLYIFDKQDLTVVDANNAACRQYGYPREQIIGLSALEMVQSHDQVSVRDHLKAMEEGKRFEGTCMHKRQDRSAMPVEMYSEAIHMNGKEYRLVLAFDISARVAAEEELKRSRDEFRKLNQHLEQIREEERTKISRELHDEIGQHMTVLKMDLAMLLRKATREESRKALHGMIELADATIATTRRISSSLRPGILDDLGLVAAIQWHCKELSRHSKIPIETHSDGKEYNFDPETNTAVFRIVQEALTNILRHAKATKIELIIGSQGDHWNISVRDNGVGFREDPANQGLGLLGMRERARALHAKLELLSRPGFGTELRLSIPLACPAGNPTTKQPQLDAHIID